MHATYRFDRVAWLASRLALWVVVGLGLHGAACTNGGFLYETTVLQDQNNGQQSNDVSQNGNAPQSGNQPTVRAHHVAMYYGTGNDSGKDPDLLSLCNDEDIDLVVLSFADRIAGFSGNANGYPSLAINGCTSSTDRANPNLADCSALGAKIATCQRRGKQFLLSIGGADAKVGFGGQAEAAQQAALFWTMFMGGTGGPRPFGTATLDGVDLDIENGVPANWGTFVTTLRKLMDADARKPYLITAAPQCPYPDEWMGPGPGTALGEALSAFDYLFVQFYNNFCRFQSNDFASAWASWTGMGANQPKILVGLPATTAAADAASFVTGPNLAKIVSEVGNHPLFGGFMFWDAGYDADTIAAGGKPMRSYAAEALNTLVIP